MRYASDAVLSRDHELRLEPQPLENGEIGCVLSFRRDEPVVGSFLPPFRAADVAEAASGARRQAEQYIARSQQALPPDPFRALGQRLFDAVFEGRRRVLFDRALTRARDAGVGLRLRVVTRADTDARIGWLPWEFLYDSRRADFLALSMLSRVVRDVGRPPRDVIDLARPPVQILAVGADVTGRMGVADELAKLQALAARCESRVRLTVLPAATREAFFDALRAQEYHVLHFIGTGVRAGWQPPDGGAPDEGALAVLPTDKAVSALAVVRAGEILEAVRNKHDLCLAMFNACDTHGVAARLAEAIPATAGFRGEISVQAGETFALELYRQLLAGEPLDTAVTACRQQVDRQLAGSREWGLLLLYLQTPDGQLIRWPQSRAPRTAESVTAVLEQAPTTFPGRRKRALLRAVLKRNLAALRERIDRADGEAPEFLQRQLTETVDQLRRLSSRRNHTER